MNDEYYMEQALTCAKACEKSSDVPVGAIIVDKDGRIIATGCNQRELLSRSTAHAEIVAIEKACEALKTWRLTDCTLYVTLEPCPMCAGAIINSRIKRVVYGAFDPKGGACGSLMNIFAAPFNHRPALTYGVLEKECSDLLSDFFESK